MEKWKYKKKVLRTNLIVVAVFLIFASIFFYIDTRKSKQLAHRLKEKYPKLLKNNKLHDNTIRSSYYPKDWRAASIFRYITLENGKKYFIMIDKKLSDKYPDFGEIARGGVILNKNRGSDTLLVKDGNKEYLFLID
jgi:hypothetical protein